MKKHGCFQISSNCKTCEIRRIKIETFNHKTYIKNEWSDYMSKINVKSSNVTNIYNGVNDIVEIAYQIIVAGLLEKYSEIEELLLQEDGELHVG
jgi:hypothetical protein